ncbi:hypothetical protein [Henriciella sp.]|uniref:DUF4760 domain-containing protein n=1 Tax=Henriciella sp. TaxID=1968823 RepID=UPI00260DD1F3|nr:hypothetical protein [Henriciella sp.]
MLNWSGNISAGDAITGLSVLLAILTFLYRNYRDNLNERRQTTFQLLSRIFEPGPVSEARITMARWIASGKTIEDDVIEDDETDRVIMYLIDFYEFTCEGAYRGVVDANLLNQESGGRMERAYIVVRNYVAAREARLTAVNEQAGLPPVKLYRYLRWFLRTKRNFDVD